MKKNNCIVNVVGGGLAGVEASWQALKLGASVKLFEMRPRTLTEAHKTGNLAEMVCSNSLKSFEEFSAPGRLKKEMQALDSLVIAAAYKAQVPAGSALAVDREVFSQVIQESLNQNPNFQRIDAEVSQLPSLEEMKEKNEVWIIATGPLTSQAMSKEINRFCGQTNQLYFYDSIAPIVATDSLNMQHCFVGDRYGKGSGDYINIPLDKVQYLDLIEDILSAEKMPLHSFEEPNYFESCLPIEVMAERGVDTLRFGPLKPVGICDPKTGKMPYANIQLRMENVYGSMHSMVGFQSKMKWPEQKRVFTKLPALENCEFLRFGSVHRNTYVLGPEVLSPELSLKAHKGVFLAGQITGVEGYSESAASGLLAGRFAASFLGLDDSFVPPPDNTMMGALLSYVTKAGKGKYAPMNANLGLLPPVKKEKGMSKRDKKAKQCKLSQLAFEKYLSANDATLKKKNEI